jgi:hypothetical protein
MRFLKQLENPEHDRISRLCAFWLKNDMGFRIVEYGLGNPFTGCIDMLATDEKNIYLITINTGRFEDALLHALMGFRRFHENIDFLSRVYSTDEIDLSLPPVILMFSTGFPPDALSVLNHGLKLPVRLFKYLAFHAEDDADLYVEELLHSEAPKPHPAVDPEALRKELEIGEAVLTDEEIRQFIAAVRG